MQWEKSLCWAYLFWLTKDFGFKTRINYWGLPPVKAVKEHALALFNSSFSYQLHTLQVPIEILGTPTQQISVVYNAIHLQHHVAI